MTEATVIPKTCPFCFAAIEPDDRFCPECGKLLDEVERIYGVRSNDFTSARLQGDERKPLFGPVQTGDSVSAIPPWYTAYDAPVVSGGLAGIFSALVSGIIAKLKQDRIDNAAAQVYLEECGAFGRDGVDWCAGGIALGVEIMTPFWAESPIITALVSGAIAFLVVLLAIQSLRPR